MYFIMKLFLTIFRNYNFLNLFENSLIFFRFVFERANDTLSITLYSSRELNKKIAEENLRLAQQQKQHQEYLDRVVYKNQPTAAFYEQFNKGTR